MRPIFTGFAPNQTTQDVFLALSYLLRPWAIWKGQERIALRNDLQKLYTLPYALPIDSGSSALLLILRAMDIQPGDEVIVQGYTCMVVANAIRAAGGTPIYVDIRKDTGNIDVSLVERAITSRTKVLIAQHTFGLPADMSALKQIVLSHHLWLIEDSAHTVGGMYQGHMLGTFGDAALISFGSEKAISGGRGGAILTSNKKLGERLEKEIEALPEFSSKNTLRQLITFPVFAIGKSLYNFLGIGRLFLGGMARLGLISKIMTPGEKKGIWPRTRPAKLPNALAGVVRQQLRDLSKTNQHRQEIAVVYQQELQSMNILYKKGSEGAPVAFAVTVLHPHEVAMAMRTQGIHVMTSWTGSPIVPKDALKTEALYKEGSCPEAEVLSSEILLLPAHRHVMKEEALYISKTLKDIVKKP